MDIALDLDGVLADLNERMIKRTDYDHEDFHTFAEWDDFDNFMSEAERVWNDHWYEIVSVEPHIKEKVRLLNADHSVDIVTNTAGDTEVVKMWLEAHSIEYDDFVRPPEDEYKDALDYDAFIDDNPHLGGDVPVQYVFDQPWNQTERRLGPGQGEYIYYSYEQSYIDSEGVPTDSPFEYDAPTVIRVNGLTDVLFDLNRWTV